MPTTIKLVVIGSPGVGKTSLRGKYLSGRFSNGYRATIGADFITKTLPHPTDPSQSIILQIWDTAGQERFSSLSTAFFRGADAALLMFDVNTPDTMLALKKWWDEFRDRAPVADEDMDGYCCVVVGNKIDTKDDDDGRPAVSKADALAFLEELVPPSLEQQHVLAPLTSHESSLTAHVQQTHSDSVDIRHHSNSQSPSTSHKSRSHSSLRFYNGTATTTSTTTFTIYHTPSSSFYHSARSSPEPSSSSSLFGSTRSTGSSFRQGSVSSGSAATITPSMYAREHDSSSNVNIDNLLPTITTSPPPSSTLPPPMERGPKLFFTSAKTGEGVADVFEYIAYRVSRRWEYEEQMEARRAYLRESGAVESIRLSLDNVVAAGTDRKGRWGHACCSS